MPAKMKANKPVRISTDPVAANAIGIMGPDKVLTYSERLTWGGNNGHQATYLARYSTQTLQECARLNRDKLADFRFYFYNGFSLLGLYNLLGPGVRGKAGFEPDLRGPWYNEERERTWFNEKAGSEGYYLINMQPGYMKTSWHRQENDINTFYPGYVRAHEVMVAEAVFAFFKARNERLLQGINHWGRSKNSYGYKVFVGSGPDPLILSAEDPHTEDNSNLGVCLVRKFDL